MSWNKPTEFSIRKERQHGPILKGIVAGAIIILGSALAYWAIFRSGRSQTVERVSEKNPGLIAEHTPAAAMTAEPEAKKKAPKKAEKDIPYWERETTNGLNEVQLRKWRHHHLPPPSWTNNAMLLREKSEFEIFDTRAENEIACLLTLEPGEGLVGSPNYGEDFREEFMRSCETPIVIDEENDSDYAKELKRTMIQAKIDLRDRMAAGEDICVIMAETREELMRLGRVKQDVEAMGLDLMKSAATPEDLETSFAAVNEMLESKGIAPIKMNPLMKRALLRRMGENQ